MIPQGTAQGFVQQVGGRMVRTNGAATGVVDIQLCALTRFNMAFVHRCDMDEYTRNFFRICHGGRARFGANFTRVANLTTAFCIKRGLV